MPLFAGGIPIYLLSPCKRPSITMQNAVFWKPKDGILECVL